MTDTATKPTATPAPGRPVPATPDLDAAQLVGQVRSAFGTGRTKAVTWRKEQLTGLHRMLTQHADEWAAALQEDLGKHPSEAWLAEIGFTTAEIDHTLKHLDRWLRPERVSVPATLQPASARIVREPLGVTLVIGAWNYPVQLLSGPVVGALAGGNAVILKPSELAPATSALTARLVPQYLDRDAVRVVEGGKDETTQLLEQRVDHIFYTGNGVVGRIILEAAAKHLTPATLELGGKSPTYVHDDADLTLAARRIAWGKFMNAGQTCVAPDYVIGSPATLARLKPALDAAIREFYGDDPQQSTAYGRIVNTRHFDRITGLLGDTATTTDRDDRYIAPTIIEHAGADHPAMQEEIFGPVLPFVEVSGVDEAIRFINERDKPLALYLFTSDDDVIRRFTVETSSGAINVNLPLAHLMVPGIPFGGVGPSGMGAYHGKHSFDTFTHAKPVLRKPAFPDTMSVVYPPFTGLKDTLFRRIIAPRRNR